jgi:very-short-patch-repair endonuclease
MVYRLAGAPQTWEQQLRLACASCDLAVISHVSAGRTWVMRRLGPDRRVHVLVPAGATPRMPGVILHRTDRIDPIDIVRRDDGIRVTSPPRTVFDLAAVLGDRALESVIEQVLAERRCTIATLTSTRAGLGGRGRRGSTRLGRVLASRPVREVPVHSDDELAFEDALRAHGLPMPERQGQVRLADGTDVHVDFLWRDLGEGVEVDHHTWHGGREATAYDNERDRRLAAVGVRISRVSDTEMDERPGDVARQVAVILHEAERRLLRRSGAIGR